MFRKIKKNLGFGFMRLPLINNEINYEETKKMVDIFMASGFNYFDTARGYLNEKSGNAIKECVVKRYNREDFILTNKLSSNYIKKREDIRPFFNSQLKECEVEYFDFYLMHALNRNNYDEYKAYCAYEEILQLKKEGKIKHIGFSFHDTAEFLEELLKEFKEIEVVQLQINYLDYDDKDVQGRLCLEVCKKYNKPVMVMEPVKGGSLVNLPSKANEIFKVLNNGSNASYAIRYAASLDNVFMVLSGMSNLEQLNDNVSYMKEFKKIDDNELKAINQVVDILKSQHLIACTNCRYCVNECKMNIPMPDIISCLNKKNVYREGNVNSQYKNIILNKGKASDCIKCGKCEKICPQHINIRELLIEAKNEFEG